MSALTDTGLGSFFAVSTREFDAAAEREGLLRHWLRLGPWRVQLRFAGSGLAEALLPAFADISDDCGGELLATISLWEERSCRELVRAVSVGC